jgi:predicted 2-oxoglutarate/Fe(II)-dependent dioxygenase YbiX
MPSRFFIEPDFLTVELCLALQRRWQQAHTETGHIPPGTRKTVIDRQVKFRVDQFINAREYAWVLERKMRQVLKPWGFRGSLELFRIGRYPRHGHFSLHRDTDAPDVANRVWSMVCWLNPPVDYVGGILQFPELGLSMKARVGTAVFFDPHLLHGVTPISNGARFTLITFACGKNTACFAPPSI